MINLRVVASVLLGVVLGAHALVAQELSQYREYALGSSVASVVALSGARADGTKTLHDRPALVQEIEWRAPYVSAGTAGADPVRDIVFSFYDDQLYRVSVTYDRDRMEGLTNDDLIESISGTYGVPLLRPAEGAHGGLPGDVRTVSTIVAQWEDGGATVILTRDAYPEQFRLALTSKALHAAARAAIAEALRLDAQEAPQRELDKRTKGVADARAASARARVVNKAAFKP